MTKLSIAPSPIAHPALAESADADEIQRAHCRHRNGCLDIADNAGWLAFSCGSCTAYKPPTPDEIAADVAGLHRLGCVAIELIQWAARERAAGRDPDERHLTAVKRRRTLRRAMRVG